MNLAEVFNRALDLLGCQSIQTVSDSSNESRTLSRNWDQSRKVILRGHPWNFAITRAVLTVSATAPVFDFDYAFPLPANYLRLTNLLVNIDDWRIESGYFITDNSEVSIAYVRDETDPALYDPICAEAIAYHLAWTCCYKLTQSQTLKDGLLKDLTTVLRGAKFVDSAEDPKKELDIDVWMRSRHGPSQGFVRDPMT